MLHTPRTCPWRQPSKGRARAYACSAAKAASPAAPPLPSSGPANSKKCVVIGGGIGGLVTAGKLAQHGYSVTVLEKNAEVGGRCQSVWQDGYRFDTGPSLLLFPDEYRKTFEWLGSSLEQHVQLHKIEPAAYRVFFADGYSSSSSSSSSSLLGCSRVPRLDGWVGRWLGVLGKGRAVERQSEATAGIRRT